MKGKRLVISFLIGLCGASLMGCSVSMQELRDAINGSDTAKLQAESSVEAATEEITLSSEEETEEETGLNALNEEEIKELQSNQADKFAYDRLNAEEQHLYVEIYTILNNMASDVEISSLNADDVDRVFQYVMNDHPELFFVEGYSMSKFTTNGETTSIQLTGKYTKTGEERAAAQETIDDYVNQCVMGAPETDSEYEKVKYVYEYIINHTEYALLAEDNQNICSVFLHGKSVCQGYAKATQYLLNRLGVYCTLISGTVKNGESHAWNLARVDGTWCYIDTTWGDASFQMDNGEEAVSGINYDYLCADDEIINQTHQAKTSLTLPACDSKKEYYYVKEGLYFTTVDETRLTELFAQGYEKGQETLTIKCADEAVYREMLSELITGEKIFDYLQDSKSVKYVKMDESHTIMFYL